MSVTPRRVVVLRERSQSEVAPAWAPQWQASILRHRVQLLLGGCMLPLWVIVSVKATMATLFINALQGFACGGSMVGCICKQWLL